LRYDPRTSKLIDKNVWEEIKSDVRLLSEHIDRHYSNTVMVTFTKHMIAQIKKVDPKWYEDSKK